MPILIKPFLYLIVFGQVAVLFASVFGLACWLLMVCVRAISVANFTWRFKTATYGRFQNSRLSISEETPNEDQRPLGPVLPGLRHLPGLRPSGLDDGPNGAALRVPAEARVGAND
jgi:hypothetical protein